MLGIGAAEQRAVVEGLKAGSVDIVIGTHRLLQRDVGFRDLGLVVVDEEHRFGVTHKERLKQLRADVDMLTLTATPIPRTLNMSLGGLRDLSLMTTAPAERVAIETFVAEWSDGLVREACLREIRRGGQVYVVHNVVEDIEAFAERLRRLVPEATVAQRITRAKRKISDAGIPYRVPAADELGARLAEVLTVIYLLFNEGYLSSGGEQPHSRDLEDDAEFLAALVHHLMPTEPEVAGLLALIRLHRARAAARFDEHGNIVKLQHQDRSRWDAERIAEGRVALDRALALHGRGPYVVQAAIASLHADEPRDWAEIAALYGELTRLTDSPVVELNRAVAVAEVEGPQAGLEIVDRLDLDRFRYLHSTRAELLRRLGRTDDARAALERAIALTDDGAERRLLERKLGELG